MLTALIVVLALILLALIRIGTLLQPIAWFLARRHTSLRLRYGDYPTTHEYP